MAILAGPQSFDPRPAKCQPVFALLFFAIGIFGLQGVFATVFAHGSVQFEAVGFQKPSLSFIWLVGPLCGTFLQPYIGLFMDQFYGKLGRRLPFIFFSGITGCFSLLGFTYADQLALVMHKSLGSNAHTWTSVSPTVAVLCFVILNISVQTLQCGLRALAVDVFSDKQQCSAAAWASTAVSLANVFYYGIASVDTQLAVSGINLAQLKLLGLVASFGLGITVCVTCLGISEPHGTGSQLTRPLNMGEFCVEPWRAMFRFAQLPSDIRRVFQIQIFSWLGWFPVLFYVVSFVRDTSCGFRLQNAQSGELGQELNEEKQRGPTRYCAEDMGQGQFVLFMISVISLISSVSIPLLLQNKKSKRTTGLPTSDFQLMRPQWVIWTAGHTIFAISIAAATVANSTALVLFLLPVCGVSWFITTWAPFAILSTMLKGNNRGMDGNLGANSHVIDAGAVLGLHNAMIAAPQIISALICGLVFWLGSADSRLTETRWILRGAAASAIVAAWLTKKHLGLFPPS